MKANYFILPLILFSATSSLAKQDMAMGGRMENRMNRMEKQLGLTSDQKPKVEAILREQAEKFRQVHQETQQRLKEVLTAEQWEKLQAMQRKRMQQWRRSAKPQP